MTGEHRVVALAEHRFDLLPIVLRSVGVFPELLVPARLVHDHDGPAGVGKSLQGLRDEGHLCGLRPRPRHRRAHVAHHAEELRVQHQKQHVLVREAVVGRAKARLPRFRHHRVAHVVVAGDVEKRRFEPGHEALELVPLAVQLRLIFRTAIDEVANAHHERRFQQIHFRNRRLEDARTSAAGAVTDDHEMEIGGSVVGREARPWHGLIGGKRQVWGDGAPTAAP